MLMAVTLIVIVIGSVLFHLISPWWTTPLASNWQQMDDTLMITVVMTGFFCCHQSFPRLCPAALSPPRRPPRRL